MSLASPITLSKSTIRHIYAMDHLFHATGQSSPKFQPKFDMCWVTSFPYNPANQKPKIEQLYHHVSTGYKFYESGKQVPNGAIAFPHHEEGGRWTSDVSFRDPNSIAVVWLCRSDYERDPVKYHCGHIRKIANSYKIQLMSNFGVSVTDVLEKFMMPYESVKYDMLSPFKPMIFPFQATGGITVDKTAIMRKAFNNRLKLYGDLALVNHNHPPLF